MKRFPLFVLATAILALPSTTTAAAMRQRDAGCSPTCSPGPAALPLLAARAAKRPLPAVSGGPLRLLGSSYGPGASLTPPDPSAFFNADTETLASVSIRGDKGRTYLQLCLATDTYRHQLPTPVPVIYGGYYLITFESAALPPSPVPFGFGLRFADHQGSLPSSEDLVELDSQYPCLYVDQTLLSFFMEESLARDLLRSDLKVSLAMNFSLQSVDGIGVLSPTLQVAGD